MDTNRINTTALAYIGDAVYEIYARKYVLMRYPQHVDALHRKAIMLVCADGQALAIKTLMKAAERLSSEGQQTERPQQAAGSAFVLTEEEQALVKRARNKKSATKAKNADPVTYKWATAFEALVGHLYLDGRWERLDALAETALAIITGEKGEVHE